MSRPAFLILVALTLVCGLAFAVWPQIDLETAGLFYGGAGFAAAHSRILEIARKVGYWAPVAIFVGCLLLYGARRFALTPWGPSGRAALFLTLTMALGPGLLVNLILKDHSHRPRPSQVQQFGGSDAFRPWYRSDGDCARNCSFVSGEVSSAFWTVAPALLAPPWMRAAAVAAALTFGTAVALLRMAFGGHFLSDALFAALFTLIVIMAVARWLRIGVADPPDARLRRRRRPL